MVETGDVTSAAPTRARATQRPRTIESGGPPPTVMPGLEPGIQAAPPAGYPQTTALDARVKPVHDGTESAASQATQTGPQSQRPAVAVTPSERGGDPKSMPTPANS